LMGKHSSLLHIEYLRHVKARQRRAFFGQFMLRASPLVVGALIGAGLADQVQAQAVNLDPTVHNITPDGRTRTTVTTTGTHSRITTETISGNVGFNTFSDFQQAAGTRVDLFVPDAAGSLVNIVSNGAAVIHGELNGYKNGEIGGNIFFSSSDGFILGQGGRINVGSLTVNTPTQEFLNRIVRADGTINDAVASQLMRGEIPLSEGGQISILGQVSANGAITLQGHSVSINGTTGPLTGDNLGQRTKFEATVNSTGMIEGGALVASGGRIAIVATGNSRIGGRVDVSATGAAQKAGTVSITGGDITIEADAAVAANGDAGGEVIVFADGTLVVQDGATFSAAGLGGGDGGFIELSGRDAHIGSVNLDLSSRAGRAGTLLIDPFNLFVGGPSTQSSLTTDVSISPNILSNGANIILQADNAITVVNGGVLDSRIMTAGVSSGNSGNITLEAPTIVLENGAQVLAGVTSASGFAGGTVTFTAARSNGGTSEIIIGQTGANGPIVTGHDITFTATSTVNQASLLIAVPTATARITANSGTITAAGQFSATATATGAGGLTLLPLGIVTTTVTSGVEIGGTTALSAAAMSASATSAVTSSILTQSLAPADSSADGAVAISTVNSTALVRLGGASTIAVTGATTLAATNSVISASDATPQAAAFGASVGVSVVNAITTAEIVDSAAVTAGSLALGANTVTDVSVKAIAGAGGATTPSPGSQATTFLTDSRYGGQATTSDGGISVAGALAISDLASTTRAQINSTALTTVAGALSIGTSSGNSASVTADGSTVTSATGVGVALGINIAKVVNDAVISSAVSAGSAALSAIRPGAGNVFTTHATSGAGATNIGVAGSFALNLIDTQSVARVMGGAVVTVAGGAVSLASDNGTAATASALPKDAGASGGSVGVGAGIAMNIVANRSFADLADDGVVTGAGALSLSALGTHTATTTAEAGSAGGVSLTPALALSLITNTTTARLGSGGVQTVAGSVSVLAAQHASVTTTASGKAAGSKAAIGAALALALVDDRALATTARNITATGAVSFTAAGASLSVLRAEASAVGAAPADDDGAAPGDDVDATATKSLQAGADKQAQAGIGDDDQRAASTAAVADGDARSASTSEGKVSVAAAVGINVQNASVIAAIPDGVVITAGGVLTLAAINNTDGQIEAIGDAVGAADASGETPPAAQIGIGAAVAVNVVKARNDATLGVAAHSVGGLALSALKRDVAGFMADPASTALREDVYLAKASSGAGASKVGLAGSLALNLVDTQSVARLQGGSVTVTGTGAVSVLSDNRMRATAEALPVGAGASGASVGIGASVALNILANRSVAEIADGAALGGAGDLTLSARGTYVAVTTAEAGSAGGVSLTPALALSLITNTTTARLGSGGVQTVAGSVSVLAAQHASVTTTASGKAAGSKAAIGAALALALVDDRALATTARNITASGAVSFTASGVSLSTLTSLASAAGAKDANDADAAPSSTGESVDKTATTEFQTGASRQQTSGIGDAEQRNATNAAANDEAGRSAATSEGKVSVAASAAINVQSAQVRAVVPDGVSIAAGGAITLASGATTSGAASADGQAVTGEDGGTSQVGIGVAVAVNVVREQNTAYLGAATHAGAGVNLRALQAEGAAKDTLLASAVSGAGGSKVGIAGSVALNIVTLDTTARIAGGATIAAGAGASSLQAANDIGATASAKPSDEGVTGGKVGVGASFAMNLITTTTTAELQDGAALNGGTGLEVEASSGLDTTTEAAAGAAGGIAVDASVALALLNQTTVARIGTGNALAMGAGAVRVSAANTGFNIATSTGENKADKVGVGASASVILGAGASDGALQNTSVTTASLARGVTAGAVTVSASAHRTYDAHATATAGGGVFSETDEKKNETTGGTSTTAESLDKTKDSQRDGEGQSNSAKKVTIAAAAGIAAAQDVVRADLSGGTITASGAVSVTATNSVGMSASGIGVAKDPGSKVGIGVGVGLAILNNTTVATIGTGTVITNAAGLTVAATSRENADGPYRSKLSALGIAGASGKSVAVAGALAVAISTGRTEAKIGNNVTVSNGGAMAVGADNESHLSSKAVAGSGSTSGVAVGGSIAVVVSDKEYGASIGAGSTLVGSALSVTAINRKIDSAPDFSFVSLDDLENFANSLSGVLTSKLLGNSNYYVEAIGGAGGSGVAVQGSFAVMVFSDRMNATIGANTTVNVGAGAVTLSSNADYVAKALSGALAASASNAGVGVSSTVIVSSGETVSKLDTNARIASAGSFSNTARAAQDIRTYAAAATAASSAGVSGVAGVVTSGNTVEALMGRGARVTISGAGAVSLAAENAFKVFGLAAGVGVGGNVGIGAAATVVTVNNTTRAALADGTSAADRGEINASGAISITATATEEGDLFSVAGAAGDVGVGAGAGIYVLGTTTEALVGNFAKVGNVFDSGSLTVRASDQSRLFAVSGAAGAGGTAGAGAGAAVGVLNKTTTAAIGASANIETGNVILEAKSGEHLSNITAGVGVGGTAGLAGAATVLSANPVTTARIGAAARVFANGNVAVLADGKTEIDMIDGAFGVGGTAGVGASIGVAVIGGSTQALVGDTAQITALGNSAAQSYITGYEAGFAAYGAGEGFSAPEFDPEADDKLTDANAAAARMAGLDLRTKRRISTPTTAMARGVIVNASGKVSQRALSVAGAAGAVGVSISAGVPVITTVTRAQIGNSAQINQIAGAAGTAQNVVVAAASDLYALGFSGSVAGGAVGVGAGVSVMVLNATTEALVGTGGVITAAGDVVVAANAIQDVVGIGAAGSVGTVGVSGGVSVMTLQTKTIARLGGVVTAQGNVDVLADDRTRTSVLAGALAIGKVGVGAAISVVNLNKEIDARISDGATVSALGLRGNHTIFTGADFGTTRADARGVNVQSNSAQSGFTLGVAGSGGGVGVSGVITLYLMDIKNTAAIANNVSINTAGGNAGADAAQDVAVTARDETVTSVAAGGVAVGLFAGVSGVVDVGIFKNTAAASIGDNVTLNAARDLRVSGLSHKAGEAYVISAGGGAVGVAAGIAIYSYGDGVAPGGDADKTIGESSQSGTLSLADILNDAQSQARNGIANDQLQGSDDERVRSISAQAQAARNAVDITSAVAGLLIPAGTSANIGSGTITVGGAVSVNSADKLNVNIVTGAVAAGVLGGGAGVGVLSVDTGSTAQIDGTGTVTAGAVTVRALTDHRMTGEHFAGSGGLLAAISADVGILTNNARTTAQIKRKAISTGGAVAVNATSTRDITVRAIGVSVAGTLAVGASVAQANIGGAVTALVSDASIGALAAPAASVAVTATSNATADTQAVAVGGGIGAALQGAGSVSRVRPSVTASVSSAQIVTSGLANISASSTGSALTDARGVAVAGGLAVGASAAEAEMSAAVATTVSGSGITAGSLTIGAQAATGQVKSYAVGAAGALVGVNATVANSRNTSSAAIGVTTSAIGIVGAASIAATSASNQNAEATGIAGGLIAAGFNRTLAQSTTTTTAVLTNLTNLSAGSLTISATGTDTNSAVTKAGSGGVVAGSAASATTRSNSTTRAGLDTTGAAAFGANIDGNATISAQHTANFGGSVDSTQASVAGASGANIGHTVDSTVDAKIGDRVQLTAQNVTLSSRNLTHNPFLSGHNVRSIAGGLVTVPAGGATVAITHNTGATVGALAVVRLVRSAAPALFRQEAYNNIVSRQKVNLDSGGAIAVANAVIDATIAANATASVGDAGKVVVDYGDIQIAAWGEGDFDMRSTATTYGLAGAPRGDANITYTGANTVSIGNDAQVQATDGDTPTNGDMPRYATITIGAGVGPAGQSANLKFNATVDIFNKTAIPIPSAPNPTVIVANSGRVTIGSTASQNMTVNPQGVRAAGDIRISAAKGNIDARAVGTGKDIYREALAKAASAISNAFGGGDVSFDYHGGSTNTDGGLARVEINGRVETGIQRYKTLTLSLLCDTGMTGCIATNPGDNIAFTLSGPFPVGTEILARVAELAQLIIDYDTDPIAKAAYRNEINFLQSKLVGLGLGSFNSAGEFVPGEFSGPSPRAALVAQAAAEANSINSVRAQLGVVAPAGVVVSLSELLEGLSEFYTDASFGLNVTSNSAISIMQGISTYGTQRHADLVSAVITQRDSGNAAVTAARNAEAEVFALRNDNVARAEAIVSAQTALQTALLNNDAGAAATQQSIIATQQTAINNNLAVINTKIAEITTHTQNAQNAAGLINHYLNTLLNELPLRPVVGTDEEKALANFLNNQDNQRRESLRAPGSADNFFLGAGSLTRVGLTQTSMATTISDLNPVLGSITSAVSTLRANTGSTPGTVGSATNSLSQIVGLLTSLTTNFVNTTIAAASAPTSTNAPMSYNIDIADTATRLGNIFVTAEQLRTTANGQLLAPGDATIQITNTTHHTLKLGNLTVPTYDAGNVRFNGVLVHSPENITSLNAGGLNSGFTLPNVVTSRTSSRGLVEILSTYRPESIANVAARKIAPDIILKTGSVIENTTGAVRLISDAGNIYVQGTINAGSVEILAKDGDFVASYVNGFNHIGGDPASFNVHTSNTEQGPGITANGAISISARYLNINSTIQSGVAEWNLTLGATPTLTASAAAIGVTEAALAAANATNAPTVINSLGQVITINRAPDGIDPVELSQVVNQYKEEIVVNANADPVRTLSIFGVPTQVNIKDYLSEQVGFSLQFTKEQAAAYAQATGTDGIFSVVRSVATDNIGASYDAKNGQYFVNGTSVKGGYIQLFGQIMNTANSTAVGRLNVLDGFGTINITNSSNIPVVLRNLSTGDDPTGTLRGVQGKIEMTDVIGVNATNPSNPIISVRKTVFTRDYVPGDAAGQVRIETQTGTIENATGNLALGGVVTTFGGDRSTTYAPEANQRYVWTTAEEYSRTSKYQQVSTQLFGSSALTISSITSLTLNGTPLLGAVTRLSDGTYVTTASTITGGGLEIINGAAFQNPNASVTQNTALSGTQMTTANQSYFTQNDFVKTGESSRRCNWWTLCIASQKTFFYELRQAYTTIVTESLKADYPIGVNFIGSNTGAINITSTQGDIVLTNTLNAAAGTVTINAGTSVGSGASIIQGDLGGDIRAKSISLTADASVGGVTDARRIGAPLTPAIAVNLTGTSQAGFGALSANAKNGNVQIISRSNVIVDQVTASGSVSAGRGTVNLFSFAGIDGKDQSARIQGPRVILTALGGSVGNTASGSLLRVNSGFSVNPADRPFGDPATDPGFDPNALLGTTITATGNIGVRSDSWAGNADGTVLAVRVQSSGGDVRIAATGQILDNNPVQTIDQRTYDQLLGFWESLGLLADDPARGVDGSVNQAKQENAIFAFETSNTQGYNQYWRMRGDAAYDPATVIRIAPDSAQFRALDAQFREDAIASGITDPALQASFAAAKISDFEAQQTAEYHRLHGVVGGLTETYDPGYRYVATEQQRADLTRGSVWTERELAFSLAPGALKTVTGTNPVLKDPNVSGRSVTIEAGLGIGETIGAGTGSLGVSIRSDLDPRNLTLDQKVALAAAERNDLLLTVGPVFLPGNATAEQIAAYNAAVAAGVGGGGGTSLNLGAEFDTLSALQQAALTAAALGLVSPSNTVLTVLSKRPVNFNAATELNLTVPNVVNGTNTDIGSVFVASRGGAALGTISTFGDTRIKVFGNITNAPGSLVQTGNLILEAAQGSIGTGGTALVLTPRGAGATQATTTARAQNGVNIAFPESGRIDTVYSPQNVKLVAQNSLLNAQNDALINVLGAQVELRAVSGSIGTAARSLNVGVQLGGQIVAAAQNEINLFGSAGVRFIIGSANAGGTIRLAAADDGVIDGVVQTPGDVFVATGGRTVFTGRGEVHTTAGLVDINSGALKMLNGAVIRADAGRVIVATRGDALVTGISSASGAINAVSVTAGGRIFAGTSDPRYDITAMTAGAGVVLNAGLGIGDRTQANETDMDNTITTLANALRIRTATLAANAADGGIALQAVSNMTLSALSAPKGPITVNALGSLAITLAESGGSQSFTAQDALTYARLVTTGLPEIPGPLDAGDITVISLASTVTGGTLDAAGSARLEGSAVTYTDIKTGADATLLARTGAVIGGDLDAGGDASLTGETTVTMTTARVTGNSTILANSGAATVGDIHTVGNSAITGATVAVTTAKVEGNSTILANAGAATVGDIHTVGNSAITGATVAVTTAKVEGDSTILANSGAATVGDIHTVGNSAITGATVAVTTAKVEGNSTILANAGAILVGDLDTDGSSEMTGTGITVTTVKSGKDSTMTAGTGQVHILTSLEAGETSRITANGVEFETIRAGIDSVIHSNADIIGTLEEAGETITNVAGFGAGNSGKLDVKTMRARNMALQATTTLDVEKAEVAENLTMRADVITALDVIQVPNGPAPLNVTLTGANGLAATLARVNVDAPAGVVMPDVFVSETVMTTTAQTVDVITAAVPRQGTSPMRGTFLLTTPAQTVFVDDRSQTPKGNPASNTQFFLNDKPFSMTLNGTTTATNSYVVVYDKTVQVTDVLGVPFDGISLQRDTVRNIRDVGSAIRLPGLTGTGTLQGFGPDGDEDEDETLDVSALDGASVEIDGIAYSVIARGDGPAVLLRQ
jgi:hypothetical protein